MSSAIAVPALPRPSHRAKDCLRPHRPPLRSGQPRLDSRVAPVGFGHDRDRPPVSDDRPLQTTTTAGGGLDLTLSTTDALAVVALAAAKSAIMAVFRVEVDDFTLRPAFPKLFMATFRSQELRDRASAVSVSQEWPSLPGGLQGHSGAATPVAPMEVQSVEAPPSAEVPAVVVPPVEVPPSAEIVVPASEEATGTVGTSEDGNSAALEDFISNVTKTIPLPLVDMPPRRR